MQALNRKGVIFEEREAGHGERGEWCGLRQVRPAGVSVQDPGTQEGIWALSSEGKEGTRKEERARSGGFAGPQAPWCLGQQSRPRFEACWSSTSCASRGSLDLVQGRPKSIVSPVRETWVQILTLPWKGWLCVEQLGLSEPQSPHL